jgi:hypothetical protein
MPVPSDHNDFEKEIERLQTIFTSKCEKVESSLDSLGDSSEIIKSLIRKEYARTMSMIQYMGTETARLLRTAIMETLLKSKAEAIKAKQMKQELYQNGNMKENQAKLRLKLETLVEDIEFLRRNMDLIAVLDSEKIQNVLRESFYFKTADCDPMMFRLDTDSVFTPKPAIVTQKPHCFKSEFLLNAIEVSWSSVDPDLEHSRYGGGSLRTPKLKESVRGLIKKNFAIKKDKHFIELNLPVFPSGQGHIEVTLFGKHIMNGKQQLETSQAGKQMDLNTSKFLDEKSILYTTNTGGMQDLDQSDLMSLDMTKRRQAAAGGGGLIQDLNPCMSLDGWAGPQPLTDRYQLSAVQEVSEPLNVSTPFSIASEAQYSTMRETSAAKLAEMLASASASAELVDTEHGVRLQGEHILAPVSETGQRGEHILAPVSESGRRSVESMQKSLSTENSPSNSRDIIDIEDTDVAPAAERSLLFAPKTMIFQELGTPQIKQDNKRYRVKEGTTKISDGVAGVAGVPRTKKVNASNVVEPVSSQVVATSVNESNESLPNISAPIFGRPIKQEMGDHTRDKTILEDSIWDDDVIVDDEDENQEIHPLENSRWEETVNEDRLTHSSSLECTLWELDNNKPEEFSFLTNKIKVDKVFESKGEFLANPTFMTHLRRNKSILVVNTFNNRVGVYDDDTLEHKGWFPCYKPDLIRPLHILALNCGSVALIESSKGKQMNGKV